MSVLTAHLDVPLDKRAPAAARHAVTAALSQWGFRDEDWLAETAVLVSELVSNAVRHGGGCLALHLEAHEGRVVLSVADGSSVVPRRRDPDDAGGRGMALIEALSAGWSVRDHQGGKQVLVELHPCPGAAPAGASGTSREGATGEDQPAQ